MRHITNADVEGSGGLVFLVGGTVVGGLGILGGLTFSCALTLESGDDSGAPDPFDFFFVMLATAQTLLHM